MELDVNGDGVVEYCPAILPVGHRAYSLPITIVPNFGFPDHHLRFYPYLFRFP